MEKSRPQSRPTAALRTRAAGWQNRRRIARLARQVERQEKLHSSLNPAARPVVFFNASTRLTGFSQNAAFSLLTSWALRLSGVPVIHFVCQAGMTHCVLGTNRDDYTTAPPCRQCFAFSQKLYAGANVRPFQFQAEARLVDALEGLDVDRLSEFVYHPDVKAGAAASWSEPVPLGALVLPAARWALRRHHLPDDEPTRYLLREYIQSAYRVALEFSALIKQAQPSTAVIFNGQMYPEAAARWAARQMGIRTITHEVGLRPFSAFFTEGEATAYPIYIPEEFELSAKQNARLDAYLEKRFKGQFSMAGIQFWPEIRGLDEAFLQHTAQFRQIVPVFTNVIFDTSQTHANTIFPHMFAWLDTVLELIREHPDTLFVIRAHPDEMRPDSKKQSRETVRDWVSTRGVAALPNVIFIDSQDYISSYELIQRSKFVMVYNSSIGLEAALMGRLVLSGGKARFTQYPIAIFPNTAEAYISQAQDLLSQEHIEFPAEFQRNARRFLYFQLYRTSLGFELYLQPGSRPGFVELALFSWQQLRPENSPTLRVLVDGISGRSPADGQQFYSKEAP